MNTKPDRRRSVATKAVSQSAWNRRSMSAPRRRGTAFALLSRAVPLDELLDAALDGRGGLVAQLVAGAVDRGEGHRDVAGLERQVLDARRLAQRGGDQLQDVAHLDGVRVAQVVDLESLQVIEGADDPGDDVVDVGEVAAEAPVAEDRQLLSAVHEPG